MDSWKKERGGRKEIAILPKDTARRRESGKKKTALRRESLGLSTA